MSLSYMFVTLEIKLWVCFLLHVLTCVTLSDSATPYSKCATPYTIGLWRKWKSCDQKHGFHSEIFLSTWSQFLLDFTTLWLSGLQLYGVVLRDTVHLYHVTSYFLLYPLLYGVGQRVCNTVCVSMQYTWVRDMMNSHCFIMESTNSGSWKIKFMDVWYSKA